MKTFLRYVVKGAVWVAHYAADHPEQVLAAVQAIQSKQKKGQQS